MPTTKPRHAITETDRVRAALETARRRWPEETQPSRLLARLIEEGRKALETHEDADRRDRLAVIDRIAGTYAGLYEPGYLEDLREEWPE